MTRAYDYTSEKDKRLLFDQQDGKCSVKACRTSLVWEKPRNFIVEHENQLSISKDNSLSNKTLRCKECAHRKTNGTKATSYGSDAHARAKIRHLRGENKPKPKRKWASRPMQSGKARWPKQKMQSRLFPKKKPPHG